MSFSKPSLSASEGDLFKGTGGELDPFFLSLLDLMLMSSFRAALILLLYYGKGRQLVSLSVTFLLTRDTEIQLCSMKMYDKLHWAKNESGDFLQSRVSQNYLVHFF